MDKQPVLVVFDILGVRCQAALDSKEAAITWLDECYEEGFFVPVMIIDETGKETLAPEILSLIGEGNSNDE